MKLPSFFQRGLIALAALLSLAAEAQTQNYEVVLAGGRVMDAATGLDAVRHVGINGGKIAVISEQPLHGSSTIDVSGHVVAPGFIDLHAHGQTTPPS